MNDSRNTTVSLLARLKWSMMAFGIAMGLMDSIVDQTEVLAI